MDYDEFNEYIENVPVPTQRLGIFRVRIRLNNNRKYEFLNLKRSMSYNKDSSGFGLNHYPKECVVGKKYKKSMYYDCEDINIDIDRSDFIWADESPSGNAIAVEMKKCNILINW